MVKYCLIYSDESRPHLGVGGNLSIVWPACQAARATLGKAPAAAVRASADTQPAGRPRDGQRIGEADRVFYPHIRSRRRRLARGP